MNPEQVKELIRSELQTINQSIANLSNQYKELKDSVSVLSGKYDAFLEGTKTSNSKLQHQARDISLIKQDLTIIDKRAVEALDEIEDLAQYIRRDCLEISGIQVDESTYAEDIVEAVGEAIGIEIDNDDISIAHQIPTYNQKSPPKVIVKFAHRKTRNKFYERRRNLSKKKAKDLPNLNLTSDAYIYISESLTPKRKFLFSEVNKVKKRLRWKFIWSNNGKIYLKQNERSRTYTFNKIDDLENFNSNHRLDDPTT